MRVGNFYAGLIIGFREGLEAFLIVSIILRYLSNIKRTELRKHVWTGSATGIVLSVLIGLGFIVIDNALKNIETFASLWESAASLIALVLVTAFIIWIIRHGGDMSDLVKKRAALNLTAGGLFIVALVMVAREGAEMAILTFAGQYSFLSILFGILISLALTVLINFSLVKVNLKVILNITLFYLILQAGFLLGTTIHEGLSAFKEIGYLSNGNAIFIKAFDLSGTLLDNKSGAIGLPAYVLFGWYSSPEWIQFIMQYAYTFFIFGFLMFFGRRKEKLPRRISIHKPRNI